MSDKGRRTRISERITKKNAEFLPSNQYYEGQKKKICDRDETSNTMPSKSGGAVWFRFQYMTYGRRVGIRKNGTSPVRLHKYHQSGNSSEKQGEMLLRSSRPNSQEVLNAIAKIQNDFMRLHLLISGLSLELRQNVRQGRLLMENHLQEFTNGQERTKLPCDRLLGLFYQISGQKRSLQTQSSRNFT